MNKSFKTSQDFSFDTNDFYTSSFDYSQKEPKNPPNPSKYHQINNWLHKQEISFPIELVPQKFSTGELFCIIINNHIKTKLKYFPNPQSSAECKFNIRKSLGYLRNLPNFKSNCIWNEDEVFQAQSQVIWSLLEGIKTYFSSKKTPSHQIPSSRSRSVIRKSSSKILEDDEKSIEKIPSQIQNPKTDRLLKDLKDKVIPWLSSLGLTKYLITSSNFIQDNMRNGVILCHIVSLIDEPLEFCENPQVVEDVYANIEIAVTAINSKVPIKKLEYYYYTELYEIWTLLYTLMLFYPELSPKKTQTGWPYTEDQSCKLKASLVNWVNKLAIYSDDIQDFAHLVGLMKNGEFLALLVKKVLGSEVLGILRNPKTSKVCLMNIEKSLRLLQREKRLSQQYTKDPNKIFEGDNKFIMLFLEDIHRMYAGLPIRKRGKSYHDDGPFIINIKSQEKRSLTPQRSYSNIIQQPLDYNSNISKNPDNNIIFCRKLVENSKSALGFYDDDSSFHIEQKENLAEFSWLKKLDVKLPPKLNLTSDLIPELSDGVLLCRILSILEMKDINGVRVCKIKTPQARRNIKLAFEVLTKKPNLSSKALYREEEVWKGDGETIRLVLGEIYRIYRNTISTLIRFNRKYRGSSFI
ncbi:hypothetical protein SteCoe_35916 [Stentor coeruleus]|uniref:Calponin-homology (CH) domain-containing protein n=1 Tax=Stentor coeruleus TaxID=5963 RepID=A0A1R2AR88_9CILI|nr:hypothetical protein SteCoe_35916 [Stentor coeruleus]